MELVWADDAPRSTQQEAGLEPFVERNVAALEHRADRGAKLSVAAATEFQAGARTLTGNRTDSIGCTAACAYRSVWPDDFFELGVRRLLIPKIGPRNDGHDRASLQRRAGCRSNPPASRINQLALYRRIWRITTKTNFSVKIDNFLTFIDSCHGRLFPRNARASSEKPDDPA